MKWGSKRDAGQEGRRAPGAASVGFCHVSGTDATTCSLAVDPDLLRLSYILRADLLLRGRAGRSEVLAEIHRLFDASPDGTPSIAALTDLGQRIAPSPSAASARSTETPSSSRIPSSVD